MDGYTRECRHNYQSVWWAVVLKNKTQDELISDLKSAGVDISVVKDERLCEMQDISCKIYISVTNLIIKERVKG